MRICKPCPMYSRLAQEDLEESTLPSNSRRSSSSASWGLLAIVIVALLLLTFPRLPQTPNSPGKRPSPAFHYMPAALPTSDEATSTENIQRGENQVIDTKTNSAETFTTSATSTGSHPQCVPAEKIGFAKTHKTASSTVQNIFLRWGLNQGWNFALLSSGSHLGPPNNQYVLDQPFQVLGQPAFYEIIQNTSRLLG